MRVYKPGESANERVKEKTQEQAQTMQQDVSTSSSIEMADLLRSLSPGDNLNPNMSPPARQDDNDVSGLQSSDETEESFPESVPAGQSVNIMDMCAKEMEVQKHADFYASTMQEPVAPAPTPRHAPPHVQPPPSLGSTGAARPPATMEYWLDIIEDNPTLNYHQAEIIRMVAQSGSREQRLESLDFAMTLLQRHRRLVESGRV
ncbi:MAG: hypothetical protein LBC94_03240 [Desulfovibrio sp.]|jgi:hypothetical protein|nr:hypothetical protein [Desulfovibrio sp.]